MSDRDAYHRDAHHRDAHHRDADTACPRIVLELPWLINGSLPAWRAREVREHLIRCAACRQELRETRVVLALFDEVAETSRPAAGARVIRPARWLRSTAGAPASWRWAAAILALLGAAYVLGSFVPGALAPAPEESYIASVAVDRPAQTDQGVLFRDGFESRDLTSWSVSDNPTSRN